MPLVNKKEKSGSLTCEDLPRLFLVVIVLNQVAGETVGSGRKTPDQQKHFFIGTDPVMSKKNKVGELENRKPKFASKHFNKHILKLLLLFPNKQMCVCFTF